MISASTIASGIVPRRSVAVLRGVPLGRDESVRFLPWLFALMAYVVGLAGVGLVMTADARHAAEEALAARLTLTVPAEASDARLQTLSALLRQTPGIAAVNPLTPAETAALLAPWLGPSAPFDELPVPRLIDLRVAPGADLDLPALRAHIVSMMPDARLDDHFAALDGSRAAARRIAVFLAAVIAGVLALVLAAAMFANRTTLTVHQRTIELVHMLGAADREIARHFAVRSLAMGLLGGAIGGIAVVATIVALGNAGGTVPLMTSSPAGLADWRVWAILIGVGLAIGAVTLASTQVMVSRHLARMP